MIGNKDHQILMCFVHLLATQSLPILFQKNHTLVVLEQKIVLNLVSLGFHEVLSPTDCWHEVIAPTISDSVELWVLSFCLVKLTMGNPLPKDRPPPLCPHMLGWIANAASTHPPLQNAGSVGTKDQWQHEHHASEMFHQVNQFVPIILVRCLHSCHQECNGCACIRSGLFGGI
jgi:hypothetical protein